MEGLRGAPFPGYYLPPGSLAVGEAGYIVYEDINKLWINTYHVIYVNIKLWLCLLYTLPTHGQHLPP